MVSLGNEARSTDSTRSPCRASSIAVAAPPTRAPTTITSYRPAPIAVSSCRYPYATVWSLCTVATVMAGQKASGQRRLTRDDWITAALAAIADGGLAAVGVEPLAARLGATKGSFYWHFENRGALLEAAIRHWEKETTTDVVAEITAARDAPGQPVPAPGGRRDRARRAGPGWPGAARQRHASRGRTSLAADHRRPAQPDHHGAPAPGIPPAEARRRALLAYSAYLGHGQLAHSTPGVLPATRAGRRAYLDDAIRALTTP